MGFSKVQSDNAIKNCATVQAALESIFYNSKTDKCRNIFGKNFSEFFLTNI